MRASTLSRRGFLAGALAVSGTAALSLAGCGSGGSGGGNATDLVYWSFDEGRVAIAKHVVESDAFKQLHPEVKVDFQQFTWAQMHDKLLAALVSGRGAPDMADIEIQRFPQFIGGDEVPFLDLTERLGPSASDLARSAAVDPWSWQGKIYGVGTELNAVTLTYREDVMSSLGITTPFATWDDVIAAGKVVSASGQMKMFGVHDLSVFDWDMVNQIMGGTFFDENGAYAGDSEAGVQALTWLRDLVHLHGIADIAPADANNNYNGPQYWAAFQANRYAAILGPAWLFTGLLKNVPDQAGKWRMQTLPTGLGASRPTAFAGGTGQAVTAQSRNVEACWDIVRLTNFSLDSSRFEYEQRGVFPTYKPALAESWLQAPTAYYGGQNIGALYQKVADQIPPWRTSPQLYKGVDAIVRLAITPVLNDRAEPAAALGQVREELARQQ
jgi:arabinosaccharide transport system substrate-binding protein